MKIGVVGCCKLKASHPAPARDLYVSRHFKIAFHWAQVFCGRVFIVSAKYGLLRPDQVIRPYDASFSRSAAARAPAVISLVDQAAWGVAVAKDLLAVVQPGDEVMFLCGRLYWRNIVKHLGSIVWSAPFQHDRLATRTAKMRKDLQ